MADTLGRQAVYGNVTLDGKPLATGMVRFEPTTGTGKTTATGAIVSNGKYSIGQADGLPVGKYFVTITSNGANAKPVPKDPAEAMKAAAESTPAEETIPAKYNTASELNAEVVKGSNKFDFTLTSEKK